MLHRCNGKGEHVNILEKLERMRKEEMGIQRRIEQTTEQLERYDRRYQVMDTVTGGSGGTQHFVIKGFPFPEYKKKCNALMESKMRQERLLEQIDRTLLEAEEYINGMDGSRKRLLLRFRYIDGMSYGDIARRLGESTSEDAIRMEVCRLMEA